MRAIPINRTDYCQFLTVRQKNYSLTYYAEHAKKCSHDVINRFLENEKYSPFLLWEHIKNDVVFAPNGYTIFDDTVLNKRNTKKIEIARSQYSGATGRITTSIGVVSLVYYNPDINRFWVIDYRIFSPDHDGATKLDHLLSMLNNAVYSKKIPFQTVLFDTWYATHKIMQHVDPLAKYYYAPIKANRNVSKTSASEPYRAVSKLQFSDKEIEHGVEIHIKGLAKDKHVNLFKFTVSTNRVDYVVTNNKTQKSSKAAQDEFGFRWVIESMHREIKQLTGIERCQCRKQRIQRNHISCAFLVWAFLKRTAHKIGKTVYQIKLGLLDDYMQQQLRSPSLCYLESYIA
ncbi:transposase [Rickettsia conorii subsp. raoultii]|uniref:Transposase n=1 Tax=Rickettsia conorii subsp. raoultii TaxID=369822 RepID=A0ABY4U0X1_RICCR|nr:transposase [Rickettsia conorii]URW78273.1 transposase [Rickettsia conorii subsp. raoultii]